MTLDVLAQVIDANEPHLRAALDLEWPAFSKRIRRILRTVEGGADPEEALTQVAEAMSAFIVTAGLFNQVRRGNGHVLETTTTVRPSASDPGPNNAWKAAERSLDDEPGAKTDRPQRRRGGAKPGPRRATAGRPNAQPPIDGAGRRGGDAGEAKKEWQVRLAFLLKKQPNVTTANEQFSLQRDIEKAREHIRELERDPTGMGELGRATT